MFTHVMVGVNDLAASKKFYDTVLGAIGLPVGRPDPKGRIFYRSKYRHHQARACAREADGAAIGVRSVLAVRHRTLPHALCARMADIGTCWHIRLWHKLLCGCYLREKRTWCDYRQTDVHDPRETLNSPRHSRASPGG